MHRRFVPFLLTALLLLGAGCSKKLLPTQPAGELSTSEKLSSELSTDRSKKDHSKRRDREATIIGHTHSGAIYALHRPQHWNGDLVVYAHGYTPPSAPIALPTADNTLAFRDLLLEHGFAFAYSSFSENGYAVKDGIRSTEDVLERFVERVGRPRRVFLAGTSLGGIVVLAMAEDHPRRYDGVMPISGVVGGSRMEIAYIANVRLLFDYFYPNALPGDLLHLPANLDINRDIVGPALAAIQAHPERAFAMSQIAQTPIPFANPQELVQSILQALAYQAIELGDLLRRTDGEPFIDNWNTRYTGALPPELLADLNNRIARYQTSHRVDRFFEKYYEPTGRLEIPMLTLHTSRDPVVPVGSEAAYRAKVAASGDLDHLVQRIDDRYGHSGFSEEQLLAAFLDLVKWADSSEKHADNEVLAGAHAE